MSLKPPAAIQKTIKEPPVCGPSEYRELACHNFVTMFGIQHLDNEGIFSHFGPFLQILPSSQMFHVVQLTM